MTSDDGRIRIEYAAVRQGHGWIPAVWKNNKRFGSTWYACEWSQEDALTCAETEARNLAAMCIGDWDVTVEPRS